MNTITAPLTVKNNTIILPEEIGKRFENKQVAIIDFGALIALKTNLSLKNKTADLSLLEKLSGILKGKKIDPLQYQKQVRREWSSRANKLEKLYAN